jgi:hypothetical protein
MSNAANAANAAGGSPRLDDETGETPYNKLYLKIYNAIALIYGADQIVNSFVQNIMRRIETETNHPQNNVNLKSFALEALDAALIIELRGKDSEETDRVIESLKVIVAMISNFIDPSNDKALFELDDKLAKYINENDQPQLQSAVTEMYELLGLKVSKAVEDQIKTYFDQTKMSYNPPPVPTSTPSATPSASKDGDNAATYLPDGKALPTVRETKSNYDFRGSRPPNQANVAPTIDGDNAATYLPDGKALPTVRETNSNASASYDFRQRRPHNQANVAPTIDVHSADTSRRESLRSEFTKRPPVDEKSRSSVPPRTGNTDLREFYDESGKFVYSRETMQRFLISKGSKIQLSTDSKTEKISFMVEARQYMAKVNAQYKQASSSQQPPSRQPDSRRLPGPPYPHLGNLSNGDEAFGDYNGAGIPPFQQPPPLGVSVPPETGRKVIAELTPDLPESLDSRNAPAAASGAGDATNQWNLQDFLESVQG